MGNFSVSVWPWTMECLTWRQQIQLPKSKTGMVFQKLIKNRVMEMRERNNEKRRRKIIGKNPVLIRSVKPGQTSALIWEKESTSTFNIWKS
jgi:hypothetical protein